MSDQSELQRSLGRIEGTLREVKEAIVVRNAGDDARFAKVEDRVGKVERKVYWASGVIAVVTAAIVAKLKTVFGT